MRAWGTWSHTLAWECYLHLDLGKTAHSLLDRPQGSSPTPQKRQPGFPKKQVSASWSLGGAALCGISHSCQLPTPSLQGAVGSIRK